MVSFLSAVSHCACPVFSSVRRLNLLVTMPESLVTEPELLVTMPESPVTITGMCSGS